MEIHPDTIHSSGMLIFGSIEVEKDEKFLKIYQLIMIDIPNYLSSKKTIRPTKQSIMKEELREVCIHAFVNAGKYIMHIFTIHHLPTNRILSLKFILR